MENIETKVTEGFDVEGRVIMSCEVWTTDDSELYGEVFYSSYKDEFTVVFGEVSGDMFDAAVEAIKNHNA